MPVYQLRELLKMKMLNTVSACNWRINLVQEVPLRIRRVTKHVRVAFQAEGKGCESVGPLFLQKANQGGWGSRQRWGEEASLAGAT